ncbi:unnamed protein product [Durusdinium trenchii]|uniref:SRCR domain-containing protein n=1 Tax=Durusdinium trenchii TaxID=1381693 RepID=A0ABP0I9U8_9DINO
MGNQLSLVDLGTGRSAKQISSGYEHVCAVLDDDSLKCWGDGTGRSAKQVSAGGFHTCAVLDDDSLKCWGWGLYGRLGYGNVEHIGDGPNEMGDSLIPIDFGTILTSIISKSVRIVGTTRQGRVQVQYQQTWRDVCDDNWNILNAQVVCRQLGLAGGISLIHLNGSGEFGMDEVACEGNECDLGYCPFRGWGIHDCSAQEAAGVKCHVDAWSTMPDPNIPARRGHSAIWNDDDDSMLVFAGHAAASFHFYNDLWRYKQDGRDGFWEEVQTVGPSPRGGHTAIWDRAGAMLVFGGSYLTTNFDELWIYSANTSSWSLASPPMKPKARAYHSGVWDAASQMMLIFAGENNGALQDLWQYQLASNNWTELSVFSFSEMPSARSRHTAVWIDAAKAMLVFGGWADTALNDLWHYALWSNSWTQLFTSSSPAGRAGHSAVWEPLTWSMLIFGGVRVNESINYTAEVWNYSLLTSSWIPMAPSGPYPAPGPREDHTAVWDPKSNYVHLFGGFDSTYKSDFWRYRSLDLEEVPVKKCFLGQECHLVFGTSGLRFGADDMIQVVDFFTLTYFVFSTSSGPAMSNGPFWLAEPGLYRISRCSKVNSLCEGHWFEFGFLLVLGPFSGQSFVCDLGSHCVVGGLQGFSLSRTDQLLPLKECGTSLQTSTFQARPISASGTDDILTDVFDFGPLDLDGAPEQVQLCWCAEDCKELEDFRALAMLFYVDGMSCVA